MGIASTVKKYLDDHEINYDVTEHGKTSSSASTAAVSNVPADKIAKGVVVKNEEGFMLVIVPASRQVQLEELRNWLKQPVTLASEDEITGLFPDCDKGAVPPVGAAYGVTTAVDRSLEGKDDIYFEGGDHRTLVHLSGAQFWHLMEKVPHERFSA